MIKIRNKLTKDDLYNQANDLNVKIIGDYLTGNNITIECVHGIKQSISPYTLKNFKGGKCKKCRSIESKKAINQLVNKKGYRWINKNEYNGYRSTLKLIMPEWS